MKPRSITVSPRKISQVKQTGRTKHPLYGRWYSMKGRCLYPSHTSWKWYGARGIKVCKRWRIFENFLADMGPIPFANASIERRRNDGNYTPNNCYWATPTAQAQNRNGALVLTLNGRTQHATAWAKELNIPYELIAQRKHKGWSDQKTLTITKRSARLLELNGVSMTRAEWSKVLGIHPGTIWWRLNSGWSVNRALTTPLDESKSSNP